MFKNITVSCPINGKTRGHRHFIKLVDEHFIQPVLRSLGESALLIQFCRLES